MNIFKEEFSSYIVKESNVYDRDISDYIRQGDQLSQLLESERIKENIRTFGIITPGNIKLLKLKPPLWRFFYLYLF